MHGALKALKEKGLATGLKAWLGEKYKAYGRVQDISIDTTARRMVLTLELLGESEPVELTLSKYEVLTENGGTAVHLGHIECSRAWLAAVLNDLADQQLNARALPIENRAVAELARTLL